jgi:hypothetical protein
MQLKNINNQLTLAASALLQVSSPLVQASDSDWDIDTALLYYGESDGRVSAVEPAIHVGKQLGDDDRIDLRLVVDVLTGATPNGAHASSTAQTFTTPSGNSSYTAAAGDTPLDDTFKDTRGAFGADWTLGLDRTSRLKLGANFSTEHDYVSMGASATYMKDFNNRNTTLSTGLAFNNDTIKPEGGIPIELSPMRSAGTGTNRASGDDTKTLTDFIIGVTQVIDRKTLVEFNYSLGMTDGYMNDPYKIVSVIDPVTGLPATGGFFDTTTTSNLPYVYEKRPDSRQRNSLFFRGAHHFDEDVLHLSYRYYWDDWDITSHTLDLKYRYQLAGSYLMPHFRYYMQDAASFYVHDLKLGTDVDAASGAVTSEYASHDYRLADLQTMTVGLKYGIPFDNGSEFSIRGEMIRQTVDDGNVPAGEETPDLDAIVLQLNYSLFW